MLSLKSNVKLDPISPQIVLAIMVCQSIYDYWKFDCVITSMNDSKHSDRSLHYKGNAFDLRTKNLPENYKDKIFLEIKQSLTEDFDVIFEGRGTVNEHIHVEYDPK